MTDPVRHQQHVDAWMARVAIDASPFRLVQLLVASVAAIWARAQRTLGDVTLLAITDRVLQQARRRFPVLRPVEVTASGLSCAGVQATDENAAELRDALRFVLVEMLCVLGTLTAGVLSAALHDELRAVGGRGADERSAVVVQLEKEETS